jgi:hypothetical protein
MGRPTGGRPLSRGRESQVDSDLSAFAYELAAKVGTSWRRIAALGLSERPTNAGRGDIPRTDGRGPLPRQGNRSLRVAGDHGTNRRSFDASGDGEPHLQLPPGFSSEGHRRGQQTENKSQSPHFLAPGARSTVRFCNSAVQGWDSSAFHSTWLSRLSQGAAKARPAGLSRRRGGRKVLANSTSVPEAWRPLQWAACMVAMLLLAAFQKAEVEK